MEYNEVFSPMVKHTFFRTVIALVANYDMESEKLDVKIAFLRGDLEEHIFME